MFIRSVGSVVALLTVLFASIVTGSVTVRLSDPQMDSLFKQAQDGAHFVCPDKSGIGRYSTGEDCTRYYSCENGRARIRQCLTGLMFDENRKRCVPQSQAVCGRQELGCPTPIESSLHGFVCPTSAKFDVECSGGRLFDGPSRRCVTPEKAKCEHPNNFVCPSNGIYSHPFGCDRYYKCCNGQANVEYCGSGRLFNGKQCVWSLGIFERCPTSPKNSTSIANNQTSTDNTNLTKIFNYEPIDSDEYSSDSPTSHDISKDQNIEEQKLEVEKIINNLSMPRKN